MLTTVPSSRAYSLKIWVPQRSEPLKACPSIHLPFNLLQTEGNKQ